MRLTSAKHKQYQGFPPDRRYRGNQSNVEEKKETLETYVIEATKLTATIEEALHESLLEKTNFWQNILERLHSECYVDVSKVQLTFSRMQ